MKIGIDISQSVYEGTGVSIYTRLLVKSLIENNRTDEFVLFGSSMRNQQLLKNYTDNLSGINFISKFSFLPPKALEFLWNGIHVFPIELLAGKCDVFHTSDWLEPPSRCPKVTTIHDLAIYKYPETFKARGGHDIVANQKRKLRLVKQDRDLIIAVSENTKQDIVEILKIPEKQIRIVYEAADPSYSPRGKNIVDQVKKKYQIDKDYFICVGTREPRKNLKRVIEAFNSLDLRDYQLAIAGRYGWGEDLNIKYQISNIKPLGFVPKDDLAGLYTGAVGLVYPSLYEGFGLPILEAMACGCPVITSNLGSMKEIAGGSGLLVNPNELSEITEAMKLLINNLSRRESYSVAGLKRIKDFSWEKAAIQTLDIYREAVS